MEVLFYEKISNNLCFTFALYTYMIFEVIKRNRFIIQ